MSSLYPDFRPRGVRREWEHTGLCLSDAGNLLRRHWVKPEKGDPVDAAAWWQDGRLRVLVADYADGSRIDLRMNMRGRVSMSCSLMPTSIKSKEPTP